MVHITAAVGSPKARVCLPGVGFDSVIGDNPESAALHSGHDPGILLADAWRHKSGLSYCCFLSRYTSIFDAQHTPATIAVSQCLILQFFGGASPFGGGSMSGDDIFSSLFSGKPSPAQ